MAPRNNNQQLNDIFESMKEWMQEMSKIVREGFEKHIQALEAEVFQLRKDHDREAEHRRQLQQQNSDLRDEVNSLRYEVDYLAEKMDEGEREKRENDIVLDNIELTDDNGDVRPPSKCLQNLVNKILLCEVINDDEIIKTTVIKKRGSPKVTIIGKLRNIGTKKAILQQKKMFVQKGLYVKENLTPRQYDLLKCTKQFARKETFKFVWSKDGDVFIRKDENSKIFVVRSKLMLNVKHFV